MRQRLARWQCFLRVYRWYNRASDPVDSMLAAIYTVGLMEAAHVAH